MSLNPDIRDQAYQFFIEEAQELLQVLETGLLELRQDRSTAKVHELMRAAHSIKGGAASVELSAVELLAHRLEDFFKALYSDDVNFDAELESLLLQGYDCLANPLGEQIDLGTFDEEAALLAAEPVFSALEARLEDALKNADSYIPSANDLGVDIVSSIFEVDVVNALEHLRTVISNPDNYDLEAELQGQLDMFSGFGELFNLPGFSEIVQTAQIALAQNPSRALEIIQATVDDCTVAKDLVLNGDRERGGEVSTQLRALAQSEKATLARETEDSLWLTETIADSSAEDIFGATLDNSDVEANIFAESVGEVDSAIDDVFGAIPEDSQPLNEAIDTDSETSNDNIEDVFGTVADDEVNIFAEPVGEVDSAIDDVFGAIPEDSQPLNEAIDTDSETINENIEDVFGTVADDEVNIFAEPSAAEIEPNVVSQDNLIQPENRETAVESIKAIYEELPSLESEPDSLTLPQTAQKSARTPTTAKTKKAQPKAAAKLSVKVDLDRLERMNNLVGELTINRNSLSLQNQQLQENVSELGQKFLRFRQLTKKLSEVSDKVVLEQRSSSLQSSIARSSTANTSAYATEFDSLEMDSYSDLYSSLQEVLEEIVQLEESVDDITIFAKQSDRTINEQRQMLSQMRDELMWVRMLPLDRVLQRFPRTLRDLSAKYDKPVDLKLKGTGVLVDKAVLEKLADPLLHLLRNGFDHGIESPQEREESGKPTNGTIEIHAYYQGNQTVIEVKDDGKGIDLTKITQKAIEKGLISAQEAAIATPERLLDLIFEPGFSTANKVSEISGRGVGMNIVRSQIETLKGKITVASIPNLGSTFTLRLPLTLTIAKLLVCSLGSTAFAIPSDSIEEIIIPTADQLKVANGQQFLLFNTRLIPIYSLPKILEYNCPIPDTDANSQAFKTISAPQDWYAPLLLLRRGQQLFALEVVSLLSEQELVIKPYGKAIAAPSYTYGCTILGDGSLIPAFDGTALISTILGEEVSPVVTTGNFSPTMEELEELDLKSAATESIASDRPQGKAITTKTKTSLKTIHGGHFNIADNQIEIGIASKTF